MAGQGRDTPDNPGKENTIAVFTGTAGDDTLLGEGGNDVLNGGAGDDYLSAAFGHSDDTLRTL